MKRFRVVGLYEPSLVVDAYTVRGAARRWHEAHAGFGVRGCILEIVEVERTDAAALVGL